MWLRNAAGLCLLAAAAAAVSHPRRRRPSLRLLGIALALHGRRALRSQALNLAPVGASVFMNAIAAEPGWRNLAVWAMLPWRTPWPATP